ncbi:hypothetical protein [Micromonospora yangpuensis]|uniref:hypothetical protein n=1 Tax=Micromonospora yangpuensis TaxID=683228 RepID=UPI000B86B5FA|nr:hypothetical protein [Micromonospora yangpuensis]
MTEELLPGGGTVFGIGRRKSQGQLARAELNQSVGHLKQAATYAARGAGATVGPRVEAARGYVAPAAVKVRDGAATGWGATVTTLAPLAVAARSGALEATSASKKAGRKAGVATKKAKAKNVRLAQQKLGRRRPARRRGAMLTGLLAAGAVAGVAGALAMRRRREQLEWAEYDPTESLEPMRDEVETIEVRTSGAPVPSAPLAEASRIDSTVTGASTTSSNSPVAGGPTGAGSSAVAGDNSASTTQPGRQPVVHPTDQVPSVAEGARDVTGRPADDISKAVEAGKARN